MTLTQRPIVPSSSREILRALIERSIRLRAKRSVLGAAWPAVAPVLLLLLYVFVFKSVFRVGIPRYPQFLFAGLLPWTFLAQALPQAIGSISSEPELVRRSRFAYELLPISTVLVVGVYFLLTLGGFIVYLAIVGQLVYVVLPALLLPLTALFFLVCSIAMLLALVDVYNRDLRMVLGNILTVWFFLVPIVYRPGMSPGPVRFLRSLDPMNMIVGQFRDILHFGQLSRPVHAVLMVLLCTGLLLGSPRCSASSVATCRRTSDGSDRGPRSLAGVPPRLRSRAAKAGGADLGPSRRRVLGCAR